MAVAHQIVVLALAWAGCAFVLLAAVGVLRMPDLYSRLHASSKAATLGVASLVAAVAVRVGGEAVWFRAAVVVAFLFITAPIAAHLIARAGFVTRVPLAEETEVNEAVGLAPGLGDERPGAGDAP